MRRRPRPAYCSMPRICLGLRPANRLIINMCDVKNNRMTTEGGRVSDVARCGSVETIKLAARMLLREEHASTSAGVCTWHRDLPPRCTVDCVSVAHLLEMKFRIDKPALIKHCSGYARAALRRKQEIRMKGTTLRERGSSGYSCDYSSESSFAQI